MRNSFHSFSLGPRKPLGVASQFRAIPARSQAGVISRYFTTPIKNAASELEETYTKPLIWMHWIGAIGMTGLVISGYIGSTISWDPKVSPPEKIEFKQWLMHLHESFGLVMLGLLVPRLAIRLTSRIPAQMPGPAWEHFFGKLSHFILYGCIIFMPISGLAFGYASGWGVPFFKWKVPGAPKEKVETPSYKAAEKFFYENHHLVGQVLEYLIPIHIAAVGFHHMFRAHNMIRRMNPFVKSVSK